MKIRVGVLLIILGGLLIALFWKDIQVGMVAKTTPQEMTALELLVDGPGDNAHVTVTGIFVRSDIHTYVSSDSAPEEYKKAWIYGSVPDEQGQHALLFLESHTAQSAIDVGDIGTQKEWTGLYKQGPDLMSESVLGELEGFFNDKDFSNVPLLVLDQHIPSQGEVFGKIGLGAVVILAGFVMIGLGAMKSK